MNLKHHWKRGDVLFPKGFQICILTKAGGGGGHIAQVKQVSGILLRTPKPTSTDFSLKKRYLSVGTRVNKN